MTARRSIGLLVAVALAALVAGPAAAQTGAKALFYGSAGSSVQPGAAAPRAARPASDLAGSYMGVRWWVELQGRDGQMRRVTTDHRFQAGDRIKLYVQTNRDGYLSLVNLGSTGRTTMLYPSAAGAGAIQASTVVEIPPGTFIRFDANPGEETLLLMLSPAPMGAPGGTLTAGPPVGAPPPPTLPAPLPATTLPPPPPPGLPGAPVASATPSAASAAEAAEASRLVNAALAKGAKDLIVEADPRSAQPASYAVAPAASLQDGGMITVRIKLKHD